MGSEPRSDASLLPLLAGSCAWQGLEDQPPQNARRESGRMAVVSSAQKLTVVIFLWKSQYWETHITCLLSQWELGNHRLSGSCVAIDVTVNIQRIMWFPVLSLRSCLLDDAN